VGTCIDLNHLFNSHILECFHINLLPLSQIWFLILTMDKLSCAKSLQN
jgi:hypothetical protein